MYFHGILIKMVRITALEAIPFKMLHRLRQDKKKKNQGELSLRHS